MRLSRLPTYQIPVKQSFRRVLALTATCALLVLLGGLLIRSMQAGQILSGLSGSPPTPDKLECPEGLRCSFRPAYFGQTDANDPKNYGNYDQANRPNDMDIRYIVIHSTEGSYEHSIDWFQNPSAHVASHYLIKSDSGEVMQMVKNKDIAWHAGNRYVNMHSIGIEHEGYMADGTTWYTDTMYRSSAALVKYLAARYNIPLDREHIIGHDQFHDLDTLSTIEMHNDPGPYWNWEYYMQLLGIKPQTTGAHGKIVMVMPPFASNQPEVSTCEGDGCSPLPAHNANFIYLRSRPEEDAPLIGDAILGIPGQPGTTGIQDWSARAMYGQRFAVAERRGGWVALWFGGQKGWVHNTPVNGKSVLQSVNGALVTPKKGKKEIPIYGRPLPEKAAYRQGVPVQKLEPLHYTMAAGQMYVAYDKAATSDYFHMDTYSHSSPGDGQLIVGKDEYVPIAFNKRQAYVRAGDVEVVK